MAEVSVIIVTRNTRELVCAAVRSVFAEGKSTATEVIVVDNGSTDGTGAALAREFPTAQYSFFDRNLGFAKANNVGAAQAGGRFLLLLNSDARLKPGSLALAVEWMQTHPECAVAGAQLFNPDGTRQNSIANFPTLATELLNKSLLRRLFPRRYPGKERRFAGPVEVESVIGAFMLIRAEVWRELGGLDERFFFFFEETDFCRQVRGRGRKVFHLPQVEVWHEQGRSASQVPVAARIEYWRSRYLYFAKNHASPVRFLLRLGLGVRLLTTWLGNGLLVLVRLGGERARYRWTVATALLNWHWRRCPASLGLAR